MLIFWTLFFKLLPLYFLIFLGFIAGKYLKVDRESIATLLIYIILPLVVMHGVMTTSITLSRLTLPFLVFLISCFFCVIVYFFARIFWHDSTRNILAYTSGTANTGYFGLPIAIALFDEKTVSLYILAIMGLNLFESSLGFFMVAKGQHSIKDSLIKLLTLPALYAFSLGLVINFSQINLGAGFEDLIQKFRGAYTILGMMIIGLGLAGIKNFKMDYIFLGAAFLIKFFFWPAIILFLIFIDKSVLHFYDESCYKVLILLSIVPLAANTVAFAALLRSQPEKAAMAVLSSTIFALFYIPLMITIFIK